MQKYNFTVPDICDAFFNEILIGDVFLNSYGGIDKFCGEIRTANCPHSNSVVKEMVEENGEGKVLVINHTGDKLCSMVGDQIAQKAFENNWRGMFVNGYIRDVEVIRNISIGVHAKNAYPMKTDKSVGVGTKDTNINIGSVSISSGDWIYVDTNGWVVSRKKLEL
jgi:regulator of ribonuclease activity A